MKTRTDLLNHLATKYNLQRYLEIGVQVPELNFDKIICRYKTGVDPDPGAKADFVMTSDEFFYTCNSLLDTIEDKGLVEKMKKHFVSNENTSTQRISFGAKFDLIFIDGLHTAEQVKKDFENALKILSPDGFIVLHDCNPEKEEHTIVPRPKERGHWNGDVYKFASNLLCKKITVDIDNGCMVFRKTDDYAHFDFDKYFKETATWEFFNDNRRELLNLISWDDFVKG
jgi:SAM-dependent methyltransferase